MALPSIYEFSYTPNGGTETNFLLGTSVGGSLNFYLYNNFNDASVDLSFKSKNYSIEATNLLNLSGILSCSIGSSFATFSCSDPTTHYNTGLNIKTTSGSEFIVGWHKIRDANYAYLSATEMQINASTLKIGSSAYFSENGNYIWNNEEGETCDLNSVEGRVSTLEDGWDEVAKKSDLPTPSFKYHIYAVFLNGDTDPSAYSVTNKYVFFTDIYTTKDPDTITTETIYSDLLSKMIWGTPMLRYNNPDSAYPYTDKTSGVLWNFDDSYTTSVGGRDYTGPAFTFKGLGDENSETRINPTVVDIKYQKVRVN